eukprot:scaffold110355_cov31-Tisochrysis_lutea.AAC.7
MPTPTPPPTSRASVCIGTEASTPTTSIGHTSWHPTSSSSPRRRATVAASSTRSLTLRNGGRAPNRWALTSLRWEAKAHHRVAWRAHGARGPGAFTPTRLPSARFDAGARAAPRRTSAFGQ